MKNNKFLNFGECLSYMSSYYFSYIVSMFLSQRDIKNNIFINLP